MRLVVETGRGRLRGVHENGLFKFRGVPYARPPVGPLRFRPPVPVEPWAGVLDTTQFAPAAPQGADDPLPLRNDINRWSEDCLRLNVWTPGLDGKRPVMVWMHGGALVRGTASRPTYDRGALAVRGDVVVVAVEYRLGALGFLHLDGSCGSDGAFPSNLGIRDQLCALRWVRDEIAAFGGDPDNVTAFGHSAGAICLGATAILPPAERVYRRAILQSGPPTAISPDNAAPVARVLLEQLGLTEATAERLREIPVEAILGAQVATWKSPGTRPLGVPFVPVIDGDVLRQHPMEALAAGDAADLTMIIGSTVDEMRPYLAVDPDLLTLDEAGLRRRCERIVPATATGAVDHLITEYRRARDRRGASTTPCDLWLAIEADRFVRFGATRAAELLSRTGAAAFSYLFAWQSPFMDGLFGSFHELELPFLFGYLDDPIATSITGRHPQRVILAEQMQQAWTTFARCSTPVMNEATVWPTYEPATRATMVLDLECRNENAPLEDERRVWEEILPLGSC